MRLEHCYICGWKHPIDMEIPEHIEPEYRMEGIIRDIHAKMHRYHDEHLTGVLISNWLTYELGEDFGEF